MKRIVFFIFGIILALMPGVVLIFSNLTTDIQGITPFGTAAFIIMVGPGFVFLGLATSVIAGIKSPKKLLVTTIVFVLHFGFIPLNNLITDNKLHSFFINNKAVLEQVSTALFVSEITTEEAQAICIAEELPFEGVHFDAQQQIVFFLIDGIQENCHGIAFRFSGLKPLDNPCHGIIDTWDTIENGWHVWSTI